MKNLIKILLIIFVFVSTAAIAYAAVDSIPVTVGVSSVFQMDLSVWKGGVGADRYSLVPIASISFGSFNMGSFTGGAPNVMVDGNQGGLIVRAKTNNGNPWTIQVRDDQPLTRSGGSDTIPNSNFVFWGWKVAGEANGTINYTTAQAISTSNQVIYSSTTAEGDTGDTRIHMQFGVNVPASRYGTYTNNIIITMTE